ncbi:hypothetical protein SBADM41S_10488 [Streptomyces badius]
MALGALVVAVALVGVGLYWIKPRTLWQDDTAGTRPTRRRSARASAEPGADAIDVSTRPGRARGP